MHRGLSPHQLTPMSGTHHPAPGRAGSKRQVPIRNAIEANCLACIDWVNDPAFIFEYHPWLVEG